ncbi:hypothetical protein [Tardibacter chloracetimidivorans]|uniref:hypothetical protein n=1 Tax=Tardibacter chloracetimidivorans TaxID=1921510 RepID=UPI000AC5E68A|nr:hypothetical protein [Tardibacter chloracetimidivorans]
MTTASRFHLLLSRLRKTHKALWYTKTEGHIARFAVGHSREVAGGATMLICRRSGPCTRRPSPTPSAQRSPPAMPTVLPPTAEQALRKAPDQAEPLMPLATVGPLLDGEQDVWLAACAGFHNSPFAEAGSPCAQPFWGCLDCPNAVITARKLPAILAFLVFVERTAAEPARDRLGGQVRPRPCPHHRQVVPAFSDAVIADARRQMESERLYLPPEARA